MSKASTVTRPLSAATVPAESVDVVRPRGEQNADLNMSEIMEDTEASEEEVLNDGKSQEEVMCLLSLLVGLHTSLQSKLYAQKEKGGGRGGQEGGRRR